MSGPMEMHLLMRRLEAIETDARRREEMQERRHRENTERFAKIEKVLIEASVYFKLGRWTMNILMAIGGGLIVAVLAKWAGVKP
jgi:hypothetical protein